jgi:hypothetical protein
VIKSMERLILITSARERDMDFRRKWRGDLPMAAKVNPSEFSTMSGVN